MPTFSRAVIAALISALPLAGCSGPGTASLATGPSTAGAQSVAMRPPADALAQPSSDPKGTGVSHIYVAQFQAFNIEEFGPTGKLVGTSPTVDGPQNMVFDPTGTLFVADFGGDAIVSFTSALAPKGSIHVPGSPVGLAVGPTGNVYTTLYPSGDVLTFDSAGNQISPTIPGPGTVTYVAVDAKGKIYVTDSGTNTVHTYKSDGTPTTPTITAGLNLPGPIVVDSTGKIYVGNGGGNGSITIYAPNGKRLKPTISVKATHGLAVAKNGNIYVTDSADSIVRAFKANGTPIGPTISGLNSPTGIAVL